MIEINPQKIEYERVSTTQTNPTRIVKNVSSTGDFIFRGGLALQAELGAKNVRQFGRFIRTPDGRRFISQQAFLQASNPSRNRLKTASGQEPVENPHQTTQLYNPGAPIAAKALSQENTSIKPNRHLNQEDFPKVANTILNAKDTIGGFQQSANNFFKKTFSIQTGNSNSQEGPVTYFSNNKGDRASLQVRYGGTFGNLTDYPNSINSSGQTAVKDFIKFRIRDAINGKWIIFPALLEGNISDNSSTSPAESSYLGRADKVYVYGSYTRTISLSVNIVATRAEEIPIIWEKVNYAKGLVAPSYRYFTSLGVNDAIAGRPVAPICYLTLGDLFNDTPGFFTSVNLAIPEGSTWELSDGVQVPHICTLAFEFTHIGKRAPQMTTNHYDNISQQFPYLRANPDYEFGKLITLNQEAGNNVPIGTGVNSGKGIDNRGGLFGAPTNQREE